MIDCSRAPERHFQARGALRPGLNTETVLSPDIQ